MWAVFRVANQNIWNGTWKQEKIGQETTYFVVDAKTVGPFSRSDSCFLFCFTCSPRRFFKTSVVAVMDQKWGKSTGGPEYIWHNDVTVTPIFDVVVYRGGVITSFFFYIFLLWIGPSHLSRPHFRPYEHFLNDLTVRFGEEETRGYF